MGNGPQLAISFGMDLKVTDHRRAERSERVEEHRPEKSIFNTVGRAEIRRKAHHSDREVIEIKVSIRSSLGDLVGGRCGL